MDESMLLLARLRYLLVHNNIHDPQCAASAVQSNTDTTITQTVVHAPYVNAERLARDGTGPLSPTVSRLRYTSAASLLIADGMVPPNGLAVKSR